MPNNENANEVKPSKEAMEAARECNRYRNENLKACSISGTVPLLRIDDIAFIIDRHFAALRAEWVEAIRLNRVVMNKWIEQRQRADSSEEIVAKLPKTADGVPVVPGSVVYFKFSGVVTRMTVACESWSGSEIDACPTIKTRWFCIPVCHESMFGGSLTPIATASIGPGSVVPKMCYSTRQTAEAAAKVGT